MNRTWLGFFLSSLLVVFIICAGGLWVTGQSSVPFYGIQVLIICINSILALAILRLDMPRLLVILLFVLIILLSVFAYGLTQISALACIDAGMSCLKRIESANKPILILLAAVPLIVLFEGWVKRAPVKEKSAFTSGEPIKEN